MLNNKIVGIFGLPRSGTTWIAKIVDSHPSVLYRHEPDWLYQQQQPLNDIVANSDCVAINDVIHNMLQLNYIRTVKLPIFPKDYLTYEKYCTRLLYIYALKMLEKTNFLKQDNANRICVPDFANIEHSQAVLLFKTIYSLYSLPRIAKALPHGYFIHIIRHPCGYIASLLRKQKLGIIAKLEKTGIPKSLLKTSLASKKQWNSYTVANMSTIEKLACKWALVNDWAISSSEHSNNIITIIYENMCADPLVQAQKLFKFLELSWNRQTKKFIQNSTNYNEQNYHGIAKIPENAANKWRSELTRADIDVIMGIVDGSQSSRLLAQKTFGN